jgi:hypothetical protein
MSELIALLVFVGLYLLAVRFGYDSREGPYSKEQELASHGVTWDELPDASMWHAAAAQPRHINGAETLLACAGQAPLPTRRPERAPVRNRLAALLRGAADRIDPMYRPETVDAKTMRILVRGRGA